MRIRAIIPNSGMDRVTLDSRERMLAAAVDKHTEISVVCISKGPASIESNTDEALAAAEIVREVIRAEQQGFEAAVIYCFSDLALAAARENVHIPVIGPGETSLAVANMIADKFSVITTVSANIARTERRLRGNPLHSAKLVSVRALDIPVADLRENPDLTRAYLQKACEQAVLTDGVDTVILGCLGMAQYGAELEQKFSITVLDPAFIALAYAQMSARLGLRHNRRAYAPYERGDQLDGFA